MAEKTPSQLIEERAAEMSDMDLYDSEPRHYVCVQTGMVFETYGEPAKCSPYTGSTEIVEQTPADFQKPTDIPANQKNPMQQTPLSPNPVPAGSAPKPGPDANWQNTPWSPNPAPDAQGTIGADQAGPQGFVAYPQQSMQPGHVPPYTTKQPGEKT